MNPLRHRLRDATFPTLSLTRHLSPAGESLSRKGEVLVEEGTLTFLAKARPSGELSGRMP